MVLYNMYLKDSLTKKLKTVDSTKTIRMYICGPTVYDKCHLGHGRVFIVFDVLYRLLLSLNYNIIYIQNITDIDDKIRNKAIKEQTSAEKIANRYINDFLMISKRLNILPPTKQPSVTENLSTIVDYIKTLLHNKKAYFTTSGIYFDITSIIYNCFVNKLEQQNRIEVNVKKKHIEDFALWKYDETGFESEFGRGFPGWHIECSAISEKYLGANFDIHGGGVDLQFPHHANEIAQSLGKNNIVPANIWVHCAFVNLKDTKMSKSLGNIINLEDIVKNEFDADVLRYFYLSNNYHHDIEFISLEQANVTMTNIRVFYFKYIYQKSIGLDNKYLEPAYDDLNTPKLLSQLGHHMENKNFTAIKTILEILGFWMKQRTDLSVEKITELILDRKNYKLQKNFEKADLITKQLNENFIQLEDSMLETFWYFK